MKFERLSPRFGACVEPSILTPGVRRHITHPGLTHHITQRDYNVVHHSAGMIGKIPARMTEKKTTSIIDRGRVIA